MSNNKNRKAKDIFRIKQKLIMRCFYTCAIDFIVFSVLFFPHKSTARPSIAYDDQNTPVILLILFCIPVIVIGVSLVEYFIKLNRK